jgi:CRP-like cAMP-binding protein
MLLQIAELVHYKAGEFVIKQGEEGHTMMIIASGKADVVIKVLDREQRIKERKESEPAMGVAGGLIEEAEEEEDDDDDDDDLMAAPESDDGPDSPSRRRSLNGGLTRKQSLQMEEAAVSVTVKTFTTGDYFGEQALVAPDCIRSADIIAVTDLVCYQFQRQDFNWLLAGTAVVSKIERMIMARQDAVWDLMGMNSVRPAHLPGTPHHPKPLTQLLRTPPRAGPQAAHADTEDAAGAAVLPQVLQEGGGGLGRGGPRARGGSHRLRRVQVPEEEDVREEKSAVRLPAPRPAAAPRLLLRGVRRRDRRAAREQAAADDTRRS